MVKSVEGVYRNGRVELLEPLAEAEGSRVIVTWVRPAGPVDLLQRGIDEAQAADLRRRLAPFAEDWDRPEMAVYDDLPPLSHRSGYSRTRTCERRTCGRRWLSKQTHWTQGWVAPDYRGDDHQQHGSCRTPEPCGGACRQWGGSEEDTSEI